VALSYPGNMPSSAIISVKNISKIYRVTDVETLALKNVSFQVNRGEFIAIMGPSGSGKSTLMHILGALDIPSSGQYLLDGMDVSKLSDDQLADIRNQKIGFIFQAFNLLPRTSALKNVCLPMAYAGISKAQRLSSAIELLTRVGLSDRMYHTSNQLSGGQQQRVAIARSLSLNPTIILADEPTGNIATAQAEEIMAIFQKLNSEGHTVIMITHEQDIADHARRILFIRDGKLESDHPVSKRRFSKLKV